MRILSKGEYTKAQLEDIFGKNLTTRQLKSKMIKLGYEIETSGKGKNYRIKILSYPNAFRVICREMFENIKQPDIVKMREFLYRLINDDKFQKLSYNQMETQMNGMLTRQTISRWVDKLIEMGLFQIDPGEYNYFKYINGEAIEVSKEEYQEAWKLYWSLQQDLTFTDKINLMGGKYVKIAKLEINPFNIEKINQLNLAIIEEKLTFLN